MHKTKRKNSGETTKIPKPIKVKKEKTEEDRTLHSMAHFVDDRLELVKQVFGTLKPKTITNLAPDFLKKKNMVDIEEHCLHELLCISTKRLISIINASKCPTDTESDPDSDVEHKEEHISLEEISSDSELEEGAAGKQRMNGTTSGRAKKNMKNTSAEQGNSGPISVLELLELQARARAIRSQLAMEPVTKIEVDSDEEKVANQADKPKKATTKASKRKTNDRDAKPQPNDKEASAKVGGVGSLAKTNGMSRPNVVEKEISEKAQKPAEITQQSGKPSKKIKLKRNYRKTTDDSATSDQPPHTEEASAVLEPPVTSRPKTPPTKERSRSLSPDVIPIMAETETLLISDSSDAEDAIQTALKSKAAAGTTAIAATVVAKPAVVEEIEEGEITDNDEDASEIVKTANPTTAEKVDDNQTVEAATNEKDKPQNIQDMAVSVEIDPNDKTSNIEQQKEQEVDGGASTDQLVPQEADITTKTEAINEPVGFNEDDDQNDDVISIGGDLEAEMIEHLEENSNSKSSFAVAAKVPDLTKKEDDDVISLGSSGDERAKDDSESWHARYLKSSKVSKVLLASRLGKRVRDKIKKSKRSKKEQDAHEASTRAEVKEVFRSRHEDGSVEQYKELLEMRQHKT